MRKTLVAALFLALCPLLTAQQPLNNDAVIRMAKAGLSDDVIITSINANPGVYDTSTDGLVALKKAKVSDKVVSAIIVKSASGVLLPLKPLLRQLPAASAPSPPRPAVPPASTAWGSITRTKRRLAGSLRRGRQLQNRRRT